MYIHAGSIFLLPRFLSFPSSNFHRVVYPQILDLFSFWNLTIYKKMDRPRTIQPLWESLYLRAVSFFCFRFHVWRSFAIEITGTSFLWSDIFCLEITVTILARLESIVVAVIFGLIFLLFVLYFIFLSPFCFALFYLLICLVEKNRMNVVEDWKERLEEHTSGIGKGSAKKQKKQALRRKMRKNKLGKWKKLRSQMENRL